MNYSVILRDNGDRVATNNEIKFFFEKKDVAEMIEFIDVAVKFIDHSPSSITIDIGV